VLAVTKGHALDRDRFDPLLIGIDKDGRWRIEPESLLVQATGDPRILRLSAKGTELVVPIHPDGGGQRSALAVLRQDDVVFPVLHGTYGEDGTMQEVLVHLRHERTGHSAALTLRLR
jgi:D-alanine-D-alanine ligase